MENITNALMLREDARPLNIALVYGIAGILVGTLVFGNEGGN